MEVKHDLYMAFDHSDLVLRKVAETRLIGHWIVDHLPAEALDSSIARLRRDLMSTSWRIESTDEQPWHRYRHESEVAILGTAKVREMLADDE